MFDNYCAYVTHIESLSQTDSQPQKRAKLSGFYKHWTNASTPIYMTIYLDVLAPLKRLSLRFQQVIHEPVKAVRRIQKFTWSMAKLKLFMDNTIENHTYSNAVE